VTLKARSHPDHSNERNKNMSAITSRERVRSVRIAAADQAVIAGAALAIGLLRLTGKAMGAAMRAIPTSTTAAELLAPTDLFKTEPTNRAKLIAATRGLKAADVVRVEAAAGLAQCAIADASVLAGPMHALETAKTESEARTARDALLATARAEHTRVFVDQLAVACAKASRAVGFAAVEAKVGTDGSARVIAQDEAGHALISEIHVSEGKEPTLETEVVGLMDGSCNAVLDRFDAELEAAGVRSASPNRTFTGGVCALDTARRFARKALRSGPASVGTGSGSKPVKQRRAAKDSHQQRQR
jgi:hypothetical protein